MLFKHLFLILFVDLENTEVAALEFLEQLKSSYGANLLFYQSGGSCGGSSPMCFEQKEFAIGDSNVLLGEIGNVPFYLNYDQYSRWLHTNLVIDVVGGMGGMFSLDNGTGRRFLVRSDVCTTEE